MKTKILNKNVIVFSFLLWLSFFSKMLWGQETLSLDMSSVLTAKEPKVTIYILSLDLLISVPIQEKHFDELLAVQGELSKNIYILEIRDPFVIRRLAKSIAGTVFVRRQKTGDGFLDTRYKLCFFDGEKLLQVVYADAFGDISIDGKVWEGKTKKDKLWLYNFWENIKADIYFKPRF